MEPSLIWRDVARLSERHLCGHVRSTNWFQLTLVVQGPPQVIPNVVLITSLNRLAVLLGRLCVILAVQELVTPRVAAALFVSFFTACLR